VKIAILTANEPLYLPAFFERFLARRAGDVAAVAVCAPVYSKQSRFTMLKRYVKAFGVWNAVRLARRVVGAKVKDALGIGRRRRRFYSVEAAARCCGVPVWHPDDVNAPAFRERLREAGVDLILSVSCPQIFKEDLIALPEQGCLNLHGADLPAYRGIAPSFWMLAKGETQAGVTIFRVGAGIDTGDVLGKRRFPIRPDDTLDSFIRRAKREACDLALETLDRIDQTAYAGPEGSNDCDPGFWVKGGRRLLNAPDKGAD
jgi:folate-dependent phosphoribosylglycinamide formyltransferase PurN